MTTEIEKNIQILAPPQRVWASLTDEIGKWWAGVCLEPIVGGKFVELWQDAGGNHVATGRVVACVPGESITFTWHEDFWPADKETCVTIVISPAKEKCLLSIKHSGWGCFSEDERRTKIDSFSEGWSDVLSVLKKYTEG